MTKIKRSELQIGDIVRLRDDAEGYNDATVYDVKNKSIHVVRPYVHTADFLTTAGVITYIGQEDFVLYADDTLITLLARRPPEQHRDKIRSIVNETRAAVEKGQNGKALELLRQL